MYSIEKLQEVFSNYLSEQKFPAEPVELYTPNQYFLGIGGKRIRPAMALLGANLYTNNIEETLPIAMSVELFHNFTLIHDDVMDNASLRRGFKTIHEKYNLNTAILSGDVLLIMAYNYLGQCKTKHLSVLFQILNKTAIEVCEGQQWDMNYAEKPVITIAEYIEMIRLKTSVLLAASLQMGAIQGGANVDDSHLLYQYALNLGIAFQIQDDFLDAFGDPKKVGKTIGGDILENKKTILLIRALEISELNNDDTLRNILSEKNFHPGDKISRVMDIFSEYKIADFAIAQREHYVKLSLDYLKQVNLPEEKKQILESLVTMLVYRTY